VGTRCADHVTPLYPQKLALTSPTGGDRSVGIVRVRTKATEFSLVCKTLLYKMFLQQTGNYVKIENVNIFLSLVTNFKPISLVPRLTEKR